MSYLLDTNVLSELRKRPGRVDPGVLGWARIQTTSQLFTSVVTVLEIELGVVQIERRDGRQGQVLRAWMETSVLAGFSGRILPVDVDIARWAARLHVPDPRPHRDALIAATAAVHAMTVVTRNEADFRSTGVPTVNPWSG